MRLTVVAVGRWKTGKKTGDKAGPERGLFEHYARRITFPFELKEVEEKSKLPPAVLKKREGELLLAKAPEGAVIVALDEKAKPLTSTALAKKIGAWRDDGIKDVVFMIGGTDGLDGMVKKRAHLSLSFGAVTWPHLLTRGLLAEQIYRAQSILSGHPYHRE